MTSGLMYIRAVYRLLPRQLTDLAVRSRVLPQLFAADTTPWRVVRHRCNDCSEKT